MASWKLIFFFTFAIKLIFINVVPSSASFLRRRVDPEPLTSIRIDPTEDIGRNNGREALGVRDENEHALGLPFSVTITPRSIIAYAQRRLVLKEKRTFRNTSPGTRITRVVVHSFNNFPHESAKLVSLDDQEVTIYFKSEPDESILFTVQLYGVWIQHD